MLTRSETLVVQMKDTIYSFDVDGSAALGSMPVRAALQPSETLKTALPEHLASTQFV